MYRFARLRDLFGGNIFITLLLRCILTLLCVYLILKIFSNYSEEFWKKYLENSTLVFIDPKTQLQEHSLKMFKKLPKYTFYKKSGPQHKPTFKTDVQIPNSKKVVGIGASKKDAQQNAANKLLKVLKVI